ncbi:threonine--tRNA ligase [Buchnera aphidicola]|uniref:threonine--tRNA ligase n=1 Tax=Buchnera aphidicola TaxID=9 RepID=UPI0031B70E2F
MPIITFFDGRHQVYDKSVSLLEIANDIRFNVSETIIAAVVNNNFVDIETIIKKDSKVKFITVVDKLALNLIRFSSMQLLAYAVKKIWPDVKIATGSITENGFYYDFDLNRSLTLQDMLLIQKKMKELCKKKYKIIKKKVQWNEAYKLYKKNEEWYKVEELKKKFKNIETLFLYNHEKNIDFYGPQVSNIRFCKFFSLLNISGAYWKKNKNNKMLQRVYGTAWVSEKELKKYLLERKEAEERDHRKISKKLNLFHIQKDSPGMVFWHNNGWIIFRELEDLIRSKLISYKYEEVKSPLMMDRNLWEKSGHLENYFENIFSTTSENKIYCIKPMNCPGHIQIFNTGIKSYKDLPIRMAEFGVCHRNESSGSLHGLMRVRSFTQDDGHVFCTSSQVRSEITYCIKMIYEIYHFFGFKKIQVKLSTRPKQRIGSNIIWDQAELDLSEVLRKSNIKFTYQVGEGAFYGPKIEFSFLDNLKRIWQCGTIQLDFYLPERLNAFYIDEKNKKKPVVLIHRAILGSMERFIGILIEEYKGKFPTWLSPIQVVIINVNEVHINYIRKLAKKMLELGIRVKLDLRKESIGFKIRYYSMQYIPYIIICGDKEVKENLVSIRTSKGKDINNIEYKVFLKKIKDEIFTRSFSQMEE